MASFPEEVEEEGEDLPSPALGEAVVEVAEAFGGGDQSRPDRRRERTSRTRRGSWVLLKHQNS